VGLRDQQLVLGIGWSAHRLKPRKPLAEKNMKSSQPVPTCCIAHVITLAMKPQSEAESISESLEIHGRGRIGDQCGGPTSSSPQQHRGEDANAPCSVVTRRARDD